MTDHELLVLAAKAAGYSGMGSWCEKGGCLTDYEGWYFDPLNDDGDALQLAVKLRMDILCGNEFVSVKCPGSKWLKPVESCGSDPYAATRRAIVRAAADFETSRDNQ